MESEIGSKYRDRSSREGANGNAGEAAPAFSFFKARRYWTIAPAVCVGSLTGAMLLFVILLVSELSSPRQQARDAAWAGFEMAYEHNRFLLAVERNESVSEITLRGDIYLSRVGIVETTSTIADVRALMPAATMAALSASAATVSQLMEGLEQPGGREALLAYLREDSRFIRETTLELARFDRKIRVEQLAGQQNLIAKYMFAIILLLLLLLGARVVINFKLRKAGRALTAELATREGILGSVDAAIIGLGERGQVLYSNRNALMLLGSCAKRGSFILDQCATGGNLLAEIGAVLRGGHGGGAGEANAMRKVRVEHQGVIRHYVIRTSTAASQFASRNGGTDASLIVVVTDVTTEEEAMLRREEYDAKLGEASRVLAYAAMSGGIVHEISQPLAAMRNYVYALKGSAGLGPGHDQGPMIELLGTEIDRAIEVVRNMRQMGPQGEQANGTCDAHEVIAHSIRLVTLGANPLPPITVLQTDRPVMIAGSLPIIGQVVVNPLKNALNASAAAGRAGARIAVNIAEDSAEIAVADFGHGVSEDAAKSMFAPFTRSTRGGMGLGLAICQRIATDLGGTLSWENSETAGAVFRFRVPLAREAVVS